MLNIMYRTCIITQQLSYCRKIHDNLSWMDRNKGLISLEVKSSISVRIFLTICPILRTLNNLKNDSEGNVCGKPHKTLPLQTKFRSIFVHRKSISVWICMISKYSHFSAGLEERLIEVKHSTNISNIHIFLCKKSLLFLLHDFISLDVRSAKWRKVYKV